MNSFSDLDKGQIAYRDKNGNLMILPIDNEKVREAFITRLMNEYIEDRDLNKLIQDMKNSARDIKEGNTKTIAEVENSVEFT